MAIVQALDAAIEAYPGRRSLSGALRISREGEVLFERAYGHASVQLDVPNRLDTRFHIASMTKMFIAAAVVRLSRDGALSLSAHPAAYAPPLSGIDPGVTLHHLLSHTAGLADVYDTPGLRMEIAAHAARGGGLLDYLVAQPALDPPGTRWRYSSTGFLLLAYVVEHVAAAPFGEVISNLFLQPLGLVDTGPDDPFVVNPGRALGQIGADSGWRNAPNDALAEIDGPREFYSTVADLDRWATALQRGEVLDEEGLALTFTPHARIGEDSGFAPGQHYGYGWFLGDRFRWVGGMTGGFRALMWQYPEEQLNVVMLWNNERVDSQGLMGALRPILFG